MDIVFVVREGANEELRHALRSVERFVPHDRVWIVGGGPEWLRGVERMRLPQSKSKYEATTRNLLAIAEHPDLSEDFQYWNDDFFALRPVPAAGPEPMHRGTVASVLADYRARLDTESHYVRGMDATRSALLEAGFGEPLSWEAHVPIVLNRKLLRESLLWGIEHVRAPVVHKRTIYGTLAGLEGREIADPKVNDVEGWVGSASGWCSTSDAVFQHGVAGRVLRDIFASPSRFEQPVGERAARSAAPQVLWRHKLTGRVVRGGERKFAHMARWERLGWEESRAWEAQERADRALAAARAAQEAAEGVPAYQGRA